ncbi:kinase-like protein [Polychaeton citri CBS 116435]|uniref:Kinase-like protein n=1 Tax=Polychaeton citri CBS 116435 TaxID=1314669 RepID=A0A9P4UKW1_9PEZI|nr:kinase-like protein [Polychaeton citri CBS 116435]
MSHQSRKENYMRQYLGISAPNSCASTTPSVHDITIGDWTLLKPAGSGAQSIVTAAISDSGDLIAVKTLEGGKGVDMHIWRLETLRSKLSKHANRQYVLKLRELIQPRVADADTYLLFSPLVGFDFYGMLVRDDSIQLGTRLDLLIQVIRGVAAFHEVDFIHRDIKPQNLGV